LFRNLLFLAWFFGFLVAFSQFAFPAFHMFDQEAFSSFIFEELFASNRLRIAVSRETYDEFIEEKMAKQFSYVVLTKVRWRDGLGWMGEGVRRVVEERLGKTPC
jgi:hypothetical protein